MRTLSGLLLVAAACGGKSAPPKPPGPPAIAPEFGATRWIPAQPTYVFTAKSLHALEGAAAGIASADDVKAALAQATDAGVDVDGGVALFSEGLDPTVVVHLAAPDKTQKLFAPFAPAPCPNNICTHAFGDVSVSWSIDHDWLWVHVTLPGSPVGSDWFEHSHSPGAASWAEHWRFAMELAGKLRAGGGRLIGFVDPHGLLARLGPRAGAALACAKLVEPVQRIGFAFDGGLDHVDARVSFELGPASSEVQHALLPPPAGWATTFASAPIAVQDNVDLNAVVAWLAPCAAITGGDLSMLTSAGVRAGRIGLLSAIDPEHPLDGRGAVALDLANNKAIASVLDRVPMRRMLEHDRDFGSLHGHRISIPTKGSVDYFLDDHVALAAIGDGMLEQVVAGARPAGEPPLVALDLHPQVLPTSVWSGMLDTLGVPRFNALVAELSRWQDLHVGLSLDGSALVLQLAGNRK
ncbi:MAG TPA: hypothetical protein VMJ10_04170 [Kofleriaceae bacterium]|nr:hypothetical protein [Kofleriaceae bacterium]